MRIKSLKLAVLSANAALLIGIAASSGLCVMQILKEGERKPAPPKSDPQSEAPVNIQNIPPLGTFSSIWTMRAVPGASSPAPAPEEDKRTARDQAEKILAEAVLIVGILPNVTAPEKGWAILSSPRNAVETTPVAPGDTFQNAIVQRIIKEGVYFEFRGHKDLFLAYSDSSPARGLTGRAAAMAARGPGGPVAPAGGPGGVPVGVSSTATTGNPEEASADAQTYDSFVETKKINDNQWQIDPRERDFIIENHPKIRAEARLAPHYDSKTGQADGVEIRGAEAGSLASKRGFEKNDIIKSVNGVAVTGLESIESLTKKFQTARSITVVYERKGKTYTVTYDVANK